MKKLCFLEFFVKILPDCRSAISCFIDFTENLLLLLRQDVFCKHNL